MVWLYEGDFLVAEIAKMFRARCAARVWSG